MNDLGTLGGTGSVGNGINASGQVTGTSSLAGDAQSHAFLYSNGTMVDLGTLGGTSYSFGYGINASGQVVGSSQSPVYTSALYHAFIYSDGAMTDLNSLVQNGFGWTLTEALAINDAGQITGVGIHSSAGGGDGTGYVIESYDAFLLTPVPEPSGLVLAGLGLLGLVALSRRES